MGHNKIAGAGQPAAHVLYLDHPESWLRYADLPLKHGTITTWSLGPVESIDPVRQKAVLYVDPVYCIASQIFPGSTRMQETRSKIQRTDQKRATFSRRLRNSPPCCAGAVE